MPNKWSRLCPLPGVDVEKIYFAAEEFIPDGSAGATFVDDIGTDGTSQINGLYFNGSADAIVFLNFITPTNYCENGKLELYGYSTGTTTGTAVHFSGTVRAVAVSEATNINNAGSELVGVECAGLGETIALNRIRKLTLDLAHTIDLDPGDFVSVKVLRDVSQDHELNRFYLIGGAFTYNKGGVK